MKDYKLIDEGAHHYILKHPNGTSFSVAKAGLSPDTHEAIRCMSDGGEVEPLPEDRSPASEPDHRLTQMEALAKTVNEIPGVQTLKAASQHLTDPLVPESVANRYGLKTAQQASAEDEASDATAAQSLAQNSEPAEKTEISSATPIMRAGMAPAQARAPQSGATPLDPIALERSGFAMQKGAANKEADAIGAQGKEEASALGQAQAKMQAEQDAYQKKMGEYAAQRDALEKEYRDGKIDPNRYMHSMGTGNRILSAISVVLGGLGGALAGEKNAGLDVIQKAIDRDIDAQKGNIDKTHNLLRINLEKTRDLGAATLQTQNMMLSMTKVQIEKAASKYKDPLAHARAQAMIGGITEKQAALETQLAQLHAQTELVNGGSGGNQGVPLSPYVANNKETAERLIPLGQGADGRPLYRIASSKEGADKVKEVHSDANTVLQNLANMRAIAAKPANALSPTERDLYKNMATQIAPMFAKIGGVNRFNMDEANANKESFGNLNGGIVTGSTLKQIDNASDYVKRAVENVRGQHILNYQSAYKNPTAVPYGKK